MTEKPVDPVSPVAELVVRGPTQLSTELRELVDEAAQIIEGATSENTRRTYASAWGAFESWCVSHSVDSIPATPETVILYLTERCHTRKMSTAELHLTAINYAHGRAGSPRPGDFPVVREFMRGLRRAKGTRSTSKEALSPEHIAAMVQALDLGTLAGLRDRALLLLGLALASRREELVSLDVEDVTEVANGLRVVIKQSKTDQEGAGDVLGIPRAPIPLICPLEAVAAWKRAASITTGPLLRSVDRHGHVGADRLSGRTVARVVKSAAERVGLDPTVFAGHSLRSGLATAAAAEQVSERHIMRQTRHRSERMVRKYIQEGTLFINNPAQPVLARVARAVLDTEDK